MGKNENRTAELYKKQKQKQKNKWKLKRKLKKEVKPARQAGSYARGAGQ